MIKPLPIDAQERQRRIDKAVQEVNDKITLAIAHGWTDCSFPISNEEPYYKEVKQMFINEGYHIFVNIYARCGGVNETIAW